ncbi:MAG: AAA family ATPase [Oscillospiraceae bacterium]|jgi:2-phosphoglycerate kinase|nr:AAA family ATPase [Oscillospiraceae bacterium]
MIIWINGAFGSGKTTAAFELARRIPGSFVYDPENIGYFIRKNTPKSTHFPDFQDDPVWRRFNADVLCRLAQYGGTVIVPMTIVNPDYYSELIEPLVSGFGAKHFILSASAETLSARLRKRFNDTWARAQIERCVAAFGSVITDTRIDTDGRSVDWVVEEIARQAEIALPPDRRGGLRKLIDRTVTLIRHIR